MADYDDTMAQGATILRGIITELGKVKELAEELEDELPAEDEGIGDAKGLAEWIAAEIEEMNGMIAVLEGADAEDEDEESDDD
jgi:hypothetical protein